MKGVGLILIGIMSLFAANTTKGQTLAAKDSAYNNWYYDSRELLYQTLKGTQYDVIFFGNSITERGPWEELLGKRYVVGNRGIGGDNTFGMKARIADVMLSKPKKIFLMMGINDVGRGLPTAVTLANYEQVVRIIQKQSPKTKIYLQSTLHMNESLLKPDYLKGKEHMVYALNEGIQDLAKKYSLPFVNLNEVLAEDGVLKAEYTMDGIHVNPDAYIRWVEYLKEKKHL